MYKLTYNVQGISTYKVAYIAASSGEQAQAALIDSYKDGAVSITYTEYMAPGTLVFASGKY